jgi:hypothetical protein
MRLLDPDSDRRSDVKILGISVDRIELISPISVMPGALIQLRHEGTFLLGEARCCRAVGSTFQIGIDVEDAFLTHLAAPLHPGPKNHPISLGS